ncbi:DUF2169 family type VI secretion system accessory protein [Polyangium aurulentum]|uniref:DUF2169 family type VI secretion system accessory protein n=1 Tax=Polyangium aurulentum TaxID=2567896 RepID=UPI0010AEE169|nr:DUF2169 domain-containing protein [Polyangium aurulentum]UQA63174.1 DUF2169 domain-containing protein [Polyangium aurulentum]
MSLANASPFAALPVPYIAPDGREVVIAIVKATFVHQGGRLLPASVQSPVRIGDLPWDPKADGSSIRYPSDVATAKKGTDVIVVGEAISKRPVTVMDVAVQVRDVTAPLRVHGPRVYYRSLGKIAVGPAAPFERQPIVYELAYGGHSDDWSIVEPRNPVGTGVAKSPSDLVDRRAPSIEHPAHPISGPSDKPEPAGFGALGTHWFPRAQYAGTYDDAWRATRMPLPPLDFDIRFFNVAHPALQLDEPLVPGDAIAILGMHEAGLLRFDLPAVRVALHGKTDDGRTLSAAPRVDTVLVEPGRDRVELTFRHTFPRGRGRTLLREVRVDVDD